MTLQARSRGYLVARHGIEITTGTPATAEVSRFGVGLDVGSGGTFGNETAYGIAEYRQHSHAMPLLPQQTGWLRLDPGQTVSARVELRFISDFWENRAITNGEQGSESSYITGDTRLDLFALPVL